MKMKISHRGISMVTKTKTYLDKKPSTKLGLKKIGQGLAKHLAKKCDHCGKERLVTAFQYYTRPDSNNCPNCELTAKIMQPLISRFFRNIQLPKETIQKLLSDPLIVKSMSCAVRGAARLGIRAPQPTAVPVVIVWNYTNHCNLNCIHCHQDAQVASQDPELTTNEVYKVLDNIINAGTPLLTFSGGEPLVKKNIFKVIQYATTHGLVCTLASNGKLMTKKTAVKLAKAGVTRVEIGLDAAEPKYHDELRNEPGSFKHACAAIKNCAELGEFDEIAVTATLNKMNYPQLSKIIDLTESLGATRFYLNRIVPAGRGKDILDIDVTPAQRMKAMLIIFKRFESSVNNGSGILCYARGMTYFARLSYDMSSGEMFHVSEILTGYDKLFQERYGNQVAKIIHKFGRNFGGCTAGLTYAGLDAHGNLLPCTVAPIHLGNLLKEPLEDIWCTHPVLEEIRNRHQVKGHCGECNYNGICGGCRYTAYAELNDWLGPDNSCPYYAKTGKN